MFAVVSPIREPTRVSLGKGVADSAHGRETRLPKQAALGA